MNELTLTPMDISVAITFGAISSIGIIIGTILIANDKRELGQMFFLVFLGLLVYSNAKFVIIFLFSAMTDTIKPSDIKYIFFLKAIGIIYMLLAAVKFYQYKKEKNKLISNQI